MTHIYAYIRNGYSKEQIKNLISGIKGAVGEGFHIGNQASTVAVKELPGDCCSDNFGALVLVYTAKGKGFDVKKKFAKLLEEAVRISCPDTGEVKMIIKEQANDMIGLNGVLRYDAKEVNDAYEAG